MLSVRGPAYPLSVCWCAAAGALFVVALRRPWQPLWRCSWCRVPCARGLLLLPALPGGRGKFHVPGLAVLLGRCAGWLPRGVAVTRCGAPVQLQQHTGAGAARQHRQQAPATCAFGRGPSCLRNPTTASYRYDGCTWLSHDVPPTYPSQREETNMCPTISQSVTRRAASFAAGSTAKLRPLFG